MLFVLIFFCAIGALLAFLGILIWKKRKIGLIHDYHRVNVRPEDVGAYTKRVGIALILLGVATAATGVVNFATRTFWGGIAFAVGFLVFFVIMHRAQKKYNGSWFG